MNNKGFTTVELILTMAVVMVIMSTISSVTYIYRDRSKYEELLTDVTNYKNTVTKIIYDDILDIGSLNGKVTKIEKVNDTSFNFVIDSKPDTSYNLTIINTDKISKPADKECNQVTPKVGIRYAGIEYLIPYSASSYEVTEAGNKKCKSLITYDGVIMNPPDGSDSNIYSLDILFSHKNLNNQFKIHLVVSK